MADVLTCGPADVTAGSATVLVQPAHLEAEPHYCAEVLLACLLALALAALFASAMEALTK